MLKVCALMAIYNEEDVLRESLKCLIADGIDVYVIDNGSTDKSLSIAEEFSGQGVIGIEVVQHSEFGKSVYNWTKILDRKKSISIELNYDWFIHVDADEIRCAPWADMTLKEGIEFVDYLGFNLINFKLFNFRLTKELSGCHDSMAGMTLYSNTEKFNSMQVKAWRKNDNVDLVKHGGHLAMVNDPKIFPQRFILKHYPLRSAVQAVRKINADRKARFSMEDMSKGWHVQYNSLPVDESALVESIYYKIDQLVEFNFDRESSLIQREGTVVSQYALLFGNLFGIPRTEEFWKLFIFKLHGIQLDNVDGIVDSHVELINIINKQGFPLSDYMEIPEELREVMTSMLVFDAIDGYIKGSPFIFDALPKSLILENIKNNRLRMI